MSRVVPSLGTGTGGTVPSSVYSKTEVDTLVNAKVSKTGDTMSGNLLFATSNTGVVHKDTGGTNWRSGVNSDGSHQTTSI